MQGVRFQRSNSHREKKKERLLDGAGQAISLTATKANFTRGVELVEERVVKGDARVVPEETKKVEMQLNHGGSD
jgi:hypothetical protein